MILIALGGNVGDANAMLEKARAAMEQRGIRIVRASRVIQTPALLPPGAPAAWDQAYANQVVAVETPLDPLPLLAALKAIEQALGRIDCGRWGPREIDLDLLAHGEAVLTHEQLILPHPGIAGRRFVLEPLQEIVPDWRHPHTGKSAAMMLAELPNA